MGPEESAVRVNSTIEHTLELRSLEDRERIVVVEKNGQHEKID